MKVIILFCIVILLSACEVLFYISPLNQKRKLSEYRLYGEFKKNELAKEYKFLHEGYFLAPKISEDHYFGFIRLLRDGTYYLKLSSEMFTKSQMIDTDGRKTSVGLYAIRKDTLLLESAAWDNLLSLSKCIIDTSGLKFIEYQLEADEYKSYKMSVEYRFIKERLPEVKIDF